MHKVRFSFFIVNFRSASLIAATIYIHPCMYMNIRVIYIVYMDKLSNKFVCMTAYNQTDKCSYIFSVYIKLSVYVCMCT